MKKKIKELILKKNYNGAVKEQIEVFRIFKNNMKKREKSKNDICIPCGLVKDPLSPVTAMG